MEKTVLYFTTELFCGPREPTKIRRNGITKIYYRTNTSWVTFNRRIRIIYYLLFSWNVFYSLSTVTVALFVINRAIVQDLIILVKKSVFVQKIAQGRRKNCHRALVYHRWRSQMNAETKRTVFVRSSRWRSTKKTTRRKCRNSSEDRNFQTIGRFDIWGASSIVSARHTITHVITRLLHHFFFVLIVVVSSDFLVSLLLLCVSPPLSRCV